VVSGNAEFIASLSRQLGPKLAPRLNTKLKDQSTLLLLAIKNRNPGMVKALLKAGANANLAADDGLTPLHSAASICDVAIIHYLLHAGADALAKDAKGDYAIEAAIRARQSESVAALFDAMHSKKAKPSQALPYDRFMLLSVENNVATQVNTLLTKAKKNVVDKQGRNSLWFAANNTNVELMLNLLAAGVPADTPDSHQIHTRFTRAHTVLYGHKPPLLPVCGNVNGYSKY
jgi:ankyrin repeat protein